MTVALAIGFVTPPYGVNLFVASGVSKLKIEIISKAALPFLLAMFICLLLIAYIPGISMFLVNLIGH
jgi:C4-dicarboxylate transporter DctM subunit